MSPESLDVLVPCAAFVMGLLLGVWIGVSNYRRPRARRTRAHGNGQTNGRLDD